MARREFKGAPVATTITAGITSGSASFSINASTGWPTGAVGPFAAVLDIGTASEEKVLCSLLSAGVLTVTTRGYDGTTATAHNLGATISNIPTSVDFDEANAHVQLAAGVHGTTGTIVGTTDTQVLTNKDLTSGTNTFPTTVATLTGTQTLTNKTLSLPITDNIKRGFSTTATAASTTTLTIASNEQQQFTGTTTQTVLLPVVSTLVLGLTYTILNNSTGVVTVQSSGSNTILAMGTGTRVTFTCVSITGTTETSWSSPVVAAGAGKVSNNKILNGDFFINQRAFTSNTANLSYNFDRFLQLVAGGGTTTVTPQVFSPGTAPVVGYEGINFLQSITATQSAAGDYGYISQRIEDVRTMANQSVVVSFWAKANTGTPKVGIQLVQNFGSGGAPSAEVSTPISAITLTTAWARYEVTITCPSIAGKTIGTTANTSYLALNLWQSAGATFATQASAIGIQNFTLSLWGIQVEAGTAATGFLTATGTYEGELSSCLRYFWAINDPFGNSSYTTGSVQTTTTVAAGLPLPTQMRAVPTLTITNTGVQIIYSNTLATSQAASINGGNATMVRLLVTTAAVLTAGDGVLVIINNGNFSAEL